MVQRTTAGAEGIGRALVGREPVLLVPATLLIVSVDPSLCFGTLGAIVTVFVIALLARGFSKLLLLILPFVFVFVVSDVGLSGSFIAPVAVAGLVCRKPNLLTPRVATDSFFGAGRRVALSLEIWWVGSMSAFPLLSQGVLFSVVGDLIRRLSSVTVGCIEGVVTSWGARLLNPKEVDTPLVYPLPRRFCVAPLTSSVIYNEKIIILIMRINIKGTLRVK